MDTPTSMETPKTQGVSGDGPRKLSHSEARLEQLVYWSQRSIPERLEAAVALTRRMNEMRGIPYEEQTDEQKADLTPSRVRRRKG